MKPAIVAYALSLIVPGSISAAELSFGGGLTVTSNAISDGQSDTGGRPALQPFFEVSRGGYYGGVWASNLKDTDGNTAEVDLYGGYRGETAGGLAYDLGYTQHFYDKTHAFSAELATAVSYPVSDRLSVVGEVSYDLGEKTFGENLGAEFGLADHWTVSATAGRADPSSSAFWGAAISYDLNESSNVALEFQDTRATRGLLALSLNYRFGAVGE
jgi:uncharacterized protein (TIGR02001 family)